METLFLGLKNKKQSNFRKKVYSLNKKFLLYVTVYAWEILSPFALCELSKIDPP